MNVTSPPRLSRSTDPVTHDELQALVEALIEEARQRARRRRQKLGAAALLLTLVGAAMFIGFGERVGGSTGATPPAHIPSALDQVDRSGTVLVTMRGYVRALRTLHSVGGPAHYREAGHFQIAWRVPVGGLVAGRTFRSVSATVSGSTSARFDGAPGNSCRGSLAVRHKPFLLRILNSRKDPYYATFRPTLLAVQASPSPIATAVSPTCSRGLFAAHWRPTRVPSHARARLIATQRAHLWWIYNHPGGGFHGANFAPLPKGGAAEGWIHSWGPSGYFHWLADFHVQRARASVGAGSYRRALKAEYAPIPGLFLKAVDPCIGNEFAACRRADGAVKRAVDKLARALGQRPAPRGLTQGVGELRRGLAALDGALALRIRLAHQSSVGAFMNADSGSIVPALNLMDRAARDLSREDSRLRLRPV